MLRGVFALLFAAALAVAGGVYNDYRHFINTPLSPLDKTTTLQIALGTPLPGILHELETHGIHPGPPLYWRVLTRRMHVQGKLHAGEYSLEPGMTPRGLLNMMAKNKVIQHQFTIVDGWTFEQLRDALTENDELRHTLAGEDDEDIMRALGSPDTPPEGWFLPETYNFVRGMSDMDILRRSHEAMQRELKRVWASRDENLPLDTPYQALILASIVEKETARADERARIAGVFVHRLELGMKLQTDPTVIYGMGSHYDGNLRRKDLETDTPFNTYTRTGLPPTPIALPGVPALVAVAHPARTDALYFVARGDGTHEFSKTLRAHDRAVDKYQLHRK